VVLDGGLAVRLKILDSADLLDGAVILLNMPVLVVRVGKGFPADGGKLFVVSRKTA